MTLANELNAGVDAAIAEIMNADATADAGPKAKTRKTKGKVKTAAEVKEANAKAAAEAIFKSQPKTLDGFELKDDADPEAITKAAYGAHEAVAAIARKDADLLSAYLDLGAFNAQASKAFKSTKIMGQYIAKHVPASQTLDPALRSNCKWLWEALNDPEHEAFDNLLNALGVNRIEDFKSGNPTVIRREYSAIIKADEAKAKAESLGIASGDDAVKAVSKAEKEAAATEFAEDLAKAVEFVQHSIAEASQTKADIGHSVSKLIYALANKKPADFLNTLNMFKVEKATKE